MYSCSVSGIVAIPYYWNTEWLNNFALDSSQTHAEVPKLTVKGNDLVLDKLVDY